MELIEKNHFLFVISENNLYQWSVSFHAFFSGFRESRYLVSWWAQVRLKTRTLLKHDWIKIFARAELRITYTGSPHYTRKRWIKINGLIVTRYDRNRGYQERHILNRINEIANKSWQFFFRFPCRQSWPWGCRRDPRDQRRQPRPVHAHRCHRPHPQRKFILSWVAIWPFSISHILDLLSRNKMVWPFLMLNTTVFSILFNLCWINLDK